MDSEEQMNLEEEVDLNYLLEEYLNSHQGSRLVDRYLTDRIHWLEYLHTIEKDME